MSSSLHARQAKAYLDALCHAIDSKERFRRHRQWWKSPGLMPAAMGIALGMTACGGTTEKPNGDGDAEVCDNDVDDDGDSQIDCADSDCADFAGCNVALYAAPVEDCENLVDDDGDKAVDCSDSDCINHSACLPTPAYMAPMEEDCTNKIDDDQDLDVDCADEDCFSNPACASAEYAAPFEDCENKIDDDEDGKIDCADPDCSDSSACGAALYAAP